MKYKYMWKAVFEDGTVLKQDAEDRYSKHDPEAEWNPTSFRDYLDYCEKSKPKKFFILDENGLGYGVSFGEYGKPCIYSTDASDGLSHPTEIFYEETEPLDDIRVIYYRRMKAEVVDGEFGEPECVGYVIGYQGIDKEGKNRKKELLVV